MKTSRTVLAFAVVSAFATLAHADGITITRGQFTPSLAPTGPRGRLEPSGPVDASATRVLYWFRFRNEGERAQVTLAWRIDGRPGPRHALTLIHGEASSWVQLPRRAAGHTFEVTVTDAAGASLHTDRVEVR